MQHSILMPFSMLSMDSTCAIEHNMTIAFSTVHQQKCSNVHKCPPQWYGSVQNVHMKVTVPLKLTFQITALAHSMQSSAV